MSDPFALVGIPIAGAALALGCLIFAWRAGKREWLLRSLPTCKTTGVFIGLVEIKGTAETESPLTSNLAKSSCVYYHWSVEEHWSRTVTETYTDDKGRTQTRTRTESGWTTVAQGGEEPPFYLKDDCGVIRIRPEGAKVEPEQVFSKTCGRDDTLYYEKGPPGAVAHSDHERSFTEYAIPLHTPLYVVGQARERDDIVAAEIASDKRAPMFLITTRTERQVTGGYRIGFWVPTVLGFVLTLGAFVMFATMQILEPDYFILTVVLAGFGYWLVWLLIGAVMLYNNLVEVRERVRQSWANVDVQLRRRHELIPNLVSAVTGLKGYEQKVQTELAHLRSQLAATPPGQPGPDFSACVPRLRAVVEAYPELKANASFLSLMTQLSDTEQRIALARSYFNDVATFYNTRIDSLPDAYVATLAGMERQALFVAEDFERAPVAVTLAR